MRTWHMCCGTGCRWHLSETEAKEAESLACGPKARMHHFDDYMAMSPLQSSQRLRTLKGLQEPEYKHLKSAAVLGSSCEWPL